MLGTQNSDFALEGANLNHPMIREAIIKRSQKKGGEASKWAFVTFKAGFEQGGRRKRSAFLCLWACKNENIARFRNKSRKKEELPVEMVARIEFREGL